MVESTWSTKNFSDTASFKLARKFKYLKEEIKVGLTTGRAEELEIRSIITEIEIMDNAEGTSGLTDADREKRTLLKLNLANKLNMEAIS